METAASAGLAAGRKGGRRCGVWEGEGRELRRS